MTEVTQAERGTLDGALDGAQDALNRMRRAHERGTGCHLTAEMIASLYVSVVGEIWAQDDPRNNPLPEQGK